MSISIINIQNNFLNNQNGITSPTSNNKLKSLFFEKNTILFLPCRYHKFVKAYV
jgi:hypothetical protein